MKAMMSSRYWFTAYTFLILLFSFSTYVVHVAGTDKIVDVIDNLALVLTTVCSVLFGSMAAVKFRERGPESQNAYVKRMQVEATLEENDDPVHA